MEFRNFKVFMKKVRKLVNRKEHSLAISIFEQRPQYTLHHLVKERYPTFKSAICDIADGLNMINLFSVLPSHGPVRSEKIEACDLISKRWDSYVETTKSLTKAFVTVKGTYFQANIHGEYISWLRPHEFSQNIPHTIDFRVMLTFLEFYETFISSILLKLTEDMAGSKKIQNGDGSNKNDDIDQLSLTTVGKANIFANLKFRISREVPNYPLQFCIKSGGGIVVDCDEDSEVSHVITDRNLDKEVICDNVEYVQPQWVFDSFNANLLLPCKSYSYQCDDLPPHYSPFTDNCPERYTDYFNMESVQDKTTTPQVAVFRRSSNTITRIPHPNANVDLSEITCDIVEGKKIVQMHQKNEIAIQENEAKNKLTTYVKALRFLSAKPGYIYRKGKLGLGYYCDERVNPTNHESTSLHKSKQQVVDISTSNEDVKLIMSKKARKLLQKMKTRK